MDNTATNYIQSIECECGETFQQDADNDLGEDVLERFTKHVIYEHMENQQRKTRPS